MTPDDDSMDFLTNLIEESGFVIVPVDAIMDLLAKMEEHVSEQTGVPVEELDGYMERLSDLLGPEEVYTMELEQIISWVNVLKQQ